MNNILIAIILIVAVIFDLKYKKFYNWLFVSSFIIAILAVVIFQGYQTLLPSFFSLAIISSIGLSLYYLKIMGAGDVKLLFVMSILMNYLAILEVFVLSIFWGGLLGLVSTILKGRFKSLISNVTNLLVYRVKPEKKELNAIPYTVALFIGWLTHLMLKQKGVSVW